MGILDKVVKLEKRIEKLAARPDAPRSPLEIRKAILDDIEERVQPAGRGRRVFPYDRVAIEVLAAPAERAAVVAVLDPAAGFQDAMVERLREAGCERVNALHVTVKTVTRRRPEWAEGAVFHVAYELTGAEADRTRVRERGASAEPVAHVSATVDATAHSSEARPVTAQLVILDGDASRKTYTLTAARTNIGRMADVTDRGHRVVRRNQVVFVESESETNQTVSRAQAHIVFAPPAEFRLYDDRSSYGTRIVRDGRMIEIPSGSPRGVKLQPGDEIYFGRARAQFLVK